MNPYHQLASDYERLLKQGRSFPLAGFKAAKPPDLPPGAPKVLFFAPHPDDECISSGLALRFMRESQMHVLNVVVTLGSRKERQSGRLHELRQACEYLGFGVMETAPNGLEKISPKTRQQEPSLWSRAVESVHAILIEHRPKVLLFPHDHDWNSTHIGTHFLVMDALAKMPADFECYIVETEFWGAMVDPNLMVEIKAEDLGDMMSATTFHVGEVARNPYHLSLPAWMMDNVRRGSEVVGGQGGATPDFAFAVLNRLRKWSNGKPSRFFEGGKFVPYSVNPATLLT